MAFSNGPQSNELVKVKYAQLRQSWLDRVPKSHTHLLGDLMLLLVALGAVEYEQHKANADDKAVMAFCDKFGIRYKAVLEARKLRKQLVNTGIHNKLFIQTSLFFIPIAFFSSSERDISQDGLGHRSAHGTAQRRGRQTAPTTRAQWHGGQNCQVSVPIRLSYL
jgi:hypothetical protein